MIEPKITIRNPSCVVRGYTDDEQNAAIVKLLTRMYNAVLNVAPDRPFTLRDVVGGHNRDFAGTPLQIIYDKYLIEYGDRQTAYSKTARDVGWFLIRALDEDERVFMSEYVYSKGKRLRAYSLV